MKHIDLDLFPEVQTSYLPESINFWTLATVAVGSGFLFLVILTIVIIYRTDPDPVLPVGQPSTVNYITPPSDSISPQEMSGSIAINLKEASPIGNSSYSELLMEKKNCSADQIRFCCEGGTFNSVSLHE